MKTITSLSIRIRNYYVLIVITFALSLNSQSTWAQENLALNKPTDQQSTNDKNISGNAVDGKTVGNKTGKTIALTYKGENNWWQVDLGATYLIEKVVIHRSSDDLNQEGLSNPIIAVSDDKNFGTIYDASQCVSQGIQTYAISNNGDPTVVRIMDKMEGRYLRIWNDANSSFLALAEVEVYGKTTANALTVAIKKGEKSEVEKILKTQDLDYNSSEALKLAIERKDASIVGSLLEKDSKVSADLMDYAFQDNYYNPDVVMKLLSASDVHLNEKNITAAIEKKDLDLIKKMIITDKSALTASHVSKALELSRKDIAVQLLDARVIQVSENELRLGIETGDFMLVQAMFDKGGAQASTNLLNEAIMKDQESIYNLLLTENAKPDSESFVLAAQQNNEDLYSSLTEKEELPDNRSLEIAIDKNNKSILDEGLQNGGNLNMAMEYAIQKRNKPAISHLIKKNGVDLNKATDFAITENDETLLSAILNDEDSNANYALELTTNANKTELAIIALKTNRTQPTQFLQTAINNNNNRLAKEMVNYGGDPDEGMELAINRSNEVLVEFFIENNASVANPDYMKTAAAHNLPITKMLINKGADKNHGIAAAAANNQEAIVVYLLQEEADPNLGMRPAVNGNHNKIVSLLLEKGADARGFVETPAQVGNVEMVKMLLNYGDDLNAGVRPAVNGNHNEVVSLLLSKGAEAQGFVAIPAKVGNVTMVKMLLEYGDDPNPGMRPAVNGNYNEVVSLLLEKGVDAQGYINVPAQIGNATMVKMLLDHNADPNPGMLPAVNGDHNEVVLMLLEKNANAMGYIATPAAKGNLKLVSMLIDFGADPENGMKAALENNRPKILEKLIASGADGNKTDYMVTAVSINCSECVPILAATGLPMDYTYSDGGTFLHHSVKTPSQLNLVMALINAEVPLDAKNNVGDTALHEAVRVGKTNIQIVEALVNAGADVNISNNSNDTPLKEAKHAQIKKALKQAGGKRKSE